MQSDEPWLVAGLGTPGPWFGGTRHNAGFLVVDQLAKRHGARFRLFRARCRVAEIEVEGRRVVLAKPQWSINLSGNPVRTVMRCRGVRAGRLVVVQDDLDFPFGASRLKRGGGPGGHNGIRSVSEAIGSRDYVRLRFGIGRPPKGQPIGKFVLQEFSNAEQAQLPTLLDRCADAVETLVVLGLNRAQDQLHTAAAHPAASH
ncbi:aminoacyl-tRNA hydrolase [Streptantibioticus rubrisoli]|uniref:Peptidyl-tRNA hydrolase n=1 Tax=Streptantibioticus rubrisoli TaxID=1387313 RepID=A0ABT1PBA2_9ACTN|nr:aminoacyl-tRNA hydrolase [Streptantibioticus rubrisoli]MCQ4042650.1 aminoacyl-tRNA hydrolase [Streptantibioticus rubrisoli]